MCSPPWLEDMWGDVLEPGYVRNSCCAAWERLRRIERFRVAENTEEEKEEDVNNNVAA